MSTPTMPSAELIFDTLFAYQRSAALKSAVELDIFTAIDEGATSASAIAKRVNASERGVRILCDYLTVYRLLSKSDHSYQLAAESAAFLSKKSPAYLGSVARFLVMPELGKYMETLPDAVRRGGARIRQQRHPFGFFARERHRSLIQGSLAFEDERPR